MILKIVCKKNVKPDLFFETGCKSRRTVKYTENQKLLLHKLERKSTDDSRLVFVTGPPGSGKTMVACKNAFKKLSNMEISKIVITRPLVTVDENLGYLPGDINNKTEPWTRPIFDYMSEIYTQYEINQLLLKKTIEICPLAYMRGRTLNNTYLIADEMQNATCNQMKMLLTRIGDDSIFVVNGDLNQSDISDNGLNEFLEKLEKLNTTQNYLNISHVKFGLEDIKRNDLVKDILDVYDR